MLVKIPRKSSTFSKEMFLFSPSSPTSDGSAAAVIVNENFIRKHPEVQKNAVEILAIEMATDLPSTFDSNDCMRLVGYDMTRRAAQNAYTKAGIKPSDVQVVELHGKSFYSTDCYPKGQLFKLSTG